MTWINNPTKEVINNKASNHSLIVEIPHPCIITTQLFRLSQNIHYSENLIITILF